MIDGLRTSTTELPEGWRWVKLGHLARFINGDRGKNYPSPTDRVDAGVPFINTGHIEPSGRLSRDRMEYIARETFERLGSGKVATGDIVYCLRGSTIGKIARNDYIEGAIASSLIIIRSGNAHLQSFIYHYLSSASGQSLARMFDNGSAQPNLSAGVLASYLIPLPPQVDLTRISNLLDVLDDKIELNRRMNETLEAMARALFKDWFVDFGPTRAKMEGRAPYLAPDIWSLFPDRLDDEGKPENWTEAPLTTFFEILGGGTPKTSEVVYWDGNIPWFSVVDTPPGSDTFVFETEKRITDEGLKNSSARLLDAGGTIISARGTIGKLAMAGRPMAFNQSCYGLKGINGYGPCFVFLVAKHMVAKLQSLAHGSVFSTITRQTFDSVRLPAPHIVIAEHFDLATSVLFERMRANVAESRTLAATRDFLLPKLMSGEVRIKDAETLVGEAT